MFPQPPRPEAGGGRGPKAAGPDGPAASSPHKAANQPQAGAPPGTPEGMPPGDEGAVESSSAAVPAMPGQGPPASYPGLRPKLARQDEDGPESPPPPMVAPRLLLPDGPALVAGLGEGVLLHPDGELEALDGRAMGRRLAELPPPMVVHAPATARRLNIAPFPAADLLELFAFVCPAESAAPTPRGLALALEMPPPSNPEAAAALLPEMAARMLRRLARLRPAEARLVAGLAATMGRAGWAWAAPVLAALGQPAARPGPDALKVWRLLPEWEDAAPPTPPTTFSVAPAEARRRLAEMLGESAEPRPQQADYASAASEAFAPREAEGSPALVLAEAGTGTGKTLGYIAPASLWAERNGAPVWLATFTRNLQRQILQELARLYPDPAERHRRVVLRKGRENYLCLLNLEDAVKSSGRGSAAIPLGLVARWAEASREGDLIAGDFPGWIAELFGPASVWPLADRRGECIHSACPHYKKCFVEHSIRRAKGATLVVANHALVMVQAALGGGEDGRPLRYVFDEGHHLFDAADGAFSAELSGAEAAELRRWLLGAEDGRGRARGLRRRAEELVADRPDLQAPLEAILHAARALPAPGWPNRLADGLPLREAAPAVQWRPEEIAPAEPPGPAMEGAGEDIPAEDIPAEEVPAEDVLGENAPRENAPRENAPGENAPEKNTPEKNAWVAEGAVPEQPGLSNDLRAVPHEEAGKPHNPTEGFLALVRHQVLARAKQEEALYDAECDVHPLIDGMAEAAGTLSRALERLTLPLETLRSRLLARLEDEAEELETGERIRIDALCRSLYRRAVMPLKAWQAMLKALGETPPEPGTRPLYVDWFAVARRDGREVDAGLHRHWLDPTIPFARDVAAPAHGVLVTSATLRDTARAQDDPEAGWRAAESRTGVRHLPMPALRAAFLSPFDYAERTRVLVVTDVGRNDVGQIAGAMGALFKAAGGGGLGLFTAIRRLRAVHERIAPRLEAAGLPLYAQHVDAMDTSTLIDVFRAEEDSCLLGTDAMRDGVDVPGRALRLLVFDRVPWPRPTILHRERRLFLSGGAPSAYDDAIARHRLRQAFGRLVRRADDKGVFVLLDRSCPSRILAGFPEGVVPRRVGLAEAVAETARFLHSDAEDASLHAPPHTPG